jgi:RNA polymerase sigma factor (sigma-70 family)
MNSDSPAAALPPETGEDLDHGSTTAEAGARAGEIEPAADRLMVGAAATMDRAKAGDTGSAAIGGTVEIAHLADHLFRHEAGKLVSVLTGMLGLGRLQLAEDMVQEALVRALKTWPYYGIPKNPAAWLTQTAKNLALDVMRREKFFNDRQPQIIAFVEQWAEQSDPVDSPAFENEIKDGRLRLMFACCHPMIPPESQTALALKTLCGFSPMEIARAYLTSEAAVAKRLVRARQRIRDSGIAFEIPAGAELEERLDGVMQTLYLLFNEGYKASSGDRLIREDLCEEAIRLATILSAHPAGDRPAVHALTALMLLNGARLRGRCDAQGNILLLQDQDRGTWDRPMIARGLMHLNRSAAGDELSVYHVEAAIAACHCVAPDFASTNWSRILELYNLLCAMDTSPVVALNRAVALAQVEGPRAALDAIEAMAGRETLDGYHLFHAVRAEFEMQLGNHQAAAGHLRKAIELAELKSEVALLQRRLQDCEGRGAR